VVIATRGHKLDADCMLAVVQTNARYIGLLGSRRKTVLIEKMLREQGIPNDRISVIHSPVGLDLGGRTPAEIALSVMAEITQLRSRGGGGQRGRRWWPFDPGGVGQGPVTGRLLRSGSPSGDRRAP